MLNKNGDIKIYFCSNIRAYMNEIIIIDNVQIFETSIISLDNLFVTNCSNASCFQFSRYTKLIFTISVSIEVTLPKFGKNE